MAITINHISAFHTQHTSIGSHLVLMLLAFRKNSEVQMLYNDKAQLEIHF
jgi:hypothetical protein